MANFKQHTGVSAGVGAIIVAPFCILATDLSISESLLAFLWCWFAGMLPDIDADEGKPLAIIFDSLTVFASILSVALLGDEAQLSIQTMVFIGVYYVVKYPVKSLVKSRTSHRGAFHSIPVGVIFSTLVCLAYSKEPQLAIALAFATFTGFLSHLILDEIFSIDLSGLRMKRSFGTALTPFTGSMARNGVIYTVMIALLFSSYIAVDSGVDEEYSDHDEFNTTVMIDEPEDVNGYE